MFKKFKTSLDIKPITTTKSKYWDFRNIYPTSIDEFKKKFFNKRKPQGIEGIWEQTPTEDPGYYGIVKEGQIYNSYFIDVTWKVPALSGSFFKDLFVSRKIDYKILNGTKFGVFSPTKDKNIYNFFHRQHCLTMDKNDQILIQHDLIWSNVWISVT